MDGLKCEIAFVSALMKYADSACVAKLERHFDIQILSSVLLEKYWILILIIQL